MRRKAAMEAKKELDREGMKTIYMSLYALVCCCCGGVVWCGVVSCRVVISFVFFLRILVFVFLRLV